MYVLRTALRASTSRPPARFIRGRRYPSSPRLRTLHTSRALAQAANPPPPPPDSTPIGENDVAKPDGEKKAADEHNEAAVGTEDPELLAQKLQRSRETSRRLSGALRRQQRWSKKSQGLPPVVVPDWFLRSRVVRSEDHPEHDEKRPRPPALSVHLSHEESGEQASCSILASRDMDAAQILSRLTHGLWGRRLDDHEKQKIEKYLDERIASVEKTASANETAASDEGEADTTTAQSPTAEVQSPAPSESQSTPTNPQAASATLSPGAIDVSALHVSAREAAELRRLTRKLVETQEDSTMSPEQKMHHMSLLSANVSEWYIKIAAAQSRRSSMSKRISRLVRTEITATIAASLSALKPSSNNSFPAAKTNVILHSPEAEHERIVDRCVFGIAQQLQSDVITLNPQDLALLAGDYLGEGSEPSPRSIRSLGYETYRMSAELDDAVEDRTEGAEEESDNPFAIRAFHMPMSAFDALRKSFKSLAYPGVGVGQYDAGANIASDDTARTPSQSETQLEDLKIASLLEGLIDATEAKRARGIVGLAQDSKSEDASKVLAKTKKPSPAFFDYSIGSEGPTLELNSALPVNVGAGISVVVNLGSASSSTKVPAKSKIIYVKDFKEMNATQYGGRIIQKLEEAVRKRRNLGESIMIVGSTCSRDLTPELSASGLRGLQGEGESSYYRTIVVEAESDSNQSSPDTPLLARVNQGRRLSNLSPVEKRKFGDVNLFHLRDMLRSLDPAASANMADMGKSHESFRAWRSIFPDTYLKRVLTQDEVHRIAMTALGLHVASPVKKAADTEGAMPQMSWAHVALAMGLLKASDAAKTASFDAIAESSKKGTGAERLAGEAGVKQKAKKRMDEKSLQRQRELHQIGATATKHEKRLMPGIADPDQIKTTFDQVHVPQDTIDSLRTITSLSLLRPDAFNYGILATEKISGALLYGPPGTGKTLLAKAVAKESGSTVLEVSGSQIMDKYVGEGEKNVAAIFSLARKLSPCIVFLDEADAVFASRNAMSERTSHRDILNQFLKEWDGLNDLSVFVMVATNRPFDLDDAVIRRLPRRLLVDLPTQADRKEILRIHLSGEQLDESVDLGDLAKRTPFYSGSDLKNIAVSAALACVKEENEHAAKEAAKMKAESAASSTIPPESESASSEITTASTTPAPSPTPTAITSQPAPTPQLHLIRGQSYTFPDKRVLHARHFDKAIQEISASISEDMASLTAIKKFDEQYGDRKGKKRRKDFGFGALAERSESAARVRA